MPQVKVNETYKRSNPQHSNTEELTTPQCSRKVKLSIQKLPLFAKKKGQTPTRGSGFTQIDTTHLLDLMEKYLPLCREEWDVLLKENTSAFPQQQRTVESLRRKFSTLHRRRIPTGDHFIPDDVNRAKHICETITERADMDDGDDVVETVGPSFLQEDLISTDLDDVIVSTEQQKDFLKPEPTVASQPRPLVRTGRMSTFKSEEDSLMSLFKISLLNDQKRRAEELERRREERKESRAQRLDESRRHEKLMEMILLLIAKSASTNN